jgi:integrase
MATVRKRVLPSGLVRFQASYVDAAGNRRAKLFDRKADADAWLVRVRRDLQLGTHVPLSDSLTVAEACHAYIDHCRGRMERRERMTKKCFILYEGLINNHILHAELGIGAIKLPKLSKSAIGDFRDRLRNRGASVLLTRKVLSVLCRVLDLAISNDQLATNSARNVAVIGTRDERTKKVQPPSREVIRILLGAASAKLRMALMFAAAIGVRAGELWAVRWRHLDLAAKELTVETRVDAYGDEDVTKSDAGMRTVPLGDALVRELKEWKLRSGFSKSDDLVFPNAAGNYTSHTSFLHREWYPLFVRLAKEQAADHPTKPAPPAAFRWHHLRHFAVSCWIAAGTPPKTVQTWAGHSTLAMTMDTYGHLFKSDDHTRAIDEIAAALFT